MVLYRLLRDLDAGDYCLVSQVDYGGETPLGSYTRRVPGRYYCLPNELPVDGLLPEDYRPETAGRLRRSRRLRWPLLLRYIAGRARHIFDIVRREKCRAVVGCTDHFYDLPAAFLASLFAGVPFYAYIFDDYYNKWINPAALRDARRIEPRVLKRAKGIIVPNEFMRDELRARYGVEPALIHNPCDLSAYERGSGEGPAGGGGEVNITYTGAVYEAHYDAFRDLVEAIESLPRRDIKLHIFTNQPPGDIEAQGIRGPVVFHPHEALTAMPDVQRRADLLFLPLAFDSPYPEVIKTSAPGKIGEYLAARRPVLVHAPPDSYPSWYFRQHECGLVADRRGPGQLAECIEAVLSDPRLRERLGANAWARARADFDESVARAQFASLLGVGAPAASS